MKIICFAVFLYIIILTFFSSCKIYKTKETTYTYEKKSIDKIESVKINFDRNIFTFFAIKGDKRYVANGSIEIRGNNINFTFPPYSEFEELSPFKKGYFKFTKIENSNLVEIYLNVYDMNNKFEIGKNNYSLFVTSVNNDDYTPLKIQEEKKLDLTQYIGKVLSIGTDYSYKDLRILIPSVGKYELDVYLQPKITVVMNSMTNNGCFSETFNPVFSSQICEKVLDEIRSFNFENNCENKFTITNSIINN